MPGMRRMRSVSSISSVVIAFLRARRGAIPNSVLPREGAGATRGGRLSDLIAFLFHRLLDLLAAHLRRVELDRYLLRLDCDRDVLDARHGADRLLDRVLAVFAGDVRRGQLQGFHGASSYLLESAGSRQCVLLMVAAAAATGARRAPLPGRGARRVGQPTLHSPFTTHLTIIVPSMPTCSVQTYG